MKYLCTEGDLEMTKTMTKTHTKTKTRPDLSIRKSSCIHKLSFFVLLYINIDNEENGISFDKDTDKDTHKDKDKDNDNDKDKDKDKSSEKTQHVLYF